MKKQKTFWAEFYTLGDGDSGITFEITQISLCGDVLRLELPSRGRREERWHFVEGTPYNDFKVDGRVWTDFGCAAKRAAHFKHIKNPWKLKGLWSQ